MRTRAMLPLKRSAKRFAAPAAGIIYDSLRHVSGLNVVAHRAGNVLDVVQTDHFEITVEAGSKRIEAKQVAA